MVTNYCHPDCNYWNNRLYFLSSSSNKILLAEPCKSSYCLFFKLHKKAIKPSKPRAIVIGIKKSKIDISYLFLFILNELSKTKIDEDDIAKAATKGTTKPKTAKGKAIKL